MATFTKRKLSGSTDGRGIKVAASSTPGTTIHTATSSTTAGTYDEIWLYCQNSDSGSIQLTLEFGGTTDPDDLIEVTIDGQAGMQLVVPGLILQNSSVVKAFGSSANVLIIHGFINTVTD